MSEICQDLGARDSDIVRDLPEIAVMSEICRDLGDLGARYSDIVRDPLAAAGKEAEWLRNLIYEIPLWPKPISTISIRCDSAATLAKVYSQVYNGKSRHLNVRHSMIREIITNGVISVEFVRTQLNLADHLTKGLARDLVHKEAVGMGLKST
ncbi:hypothetical protein L2E82_51456 [Cichorium intybus]|nr:hypothetical protein L2E82_51456 [Cichorium intybus]